MSFSRGKLLRKTRAPSIESEASTSLGSPPFWEEDFASSARSSSTRKPESADVKRKTTDEQELDSVESRSPLIVDSPWEEVGGDENGNASSLPPKTQLLKMAHRFVRRRKDRHDDDPEGKGTSKNTSPSPLTPDKTDEEYSRRQDPYLSFQGDFEVPIIEDTGSFYDEDGIYRKGEPESTRSSADIDDSAVDLASPPAAIFSPTSAARTPGEAEGGHPKKKKWVEEPGRSVNSWWKSWKINALFGMFWLFFLHELVSIAVTLSVSSYALIGAVQNFEDDSTSVLRTLSQDNVQILNQTFQALQEVLADETRNNVSAYIVRTTYPAYSIRDGILSGLASPPLYTSWTQLTPENSLSFFNPYMQYIRYKKQEFQEATVKIGVGFDADGTFFGISANRSNSTISMETLPAPQYFMSLPVFTDDPNRAPFCNIPEEYTGVKYNASTRGCKDQAWYYQRCQLLRDETRCDPNQPVLKVSKYNVHERAWYISVRELNTPTPAQVVSSTATPGMYPLGAPFWSPSYEYASATGVGITFGVPIISSSPGPSSTFVGVASSDLYLDNLSAYMKGILDGRIVQTGVAFIVELTTVEPHYPSLRIASGKLIASSDVTQGVVATPGGGLTLPNATESSNSLIASSASMVLNMYDRNWQGVPENGTASYSLERGPATQCEPVIDRIGSPSNLSYCAFIRWTRLQLPVEAGNGLDWVLFIVLPDTEFLAQAKEAANHAQTTIEILGKNAQEDIAGSIKRTLMIAGTWVLLSGGFAFLISYGLSKPLKVLASDMLDVAKLRFGDVKPELSSRIREVHEMGSAYLNMREGLEGFARFVPETVVRRIVSGDRKASKLYVTRRNVTVLFSDIKNFTTISEAIPLSELIQLLAEYLARMGRIVELTQGTVGDFIGDGIMVFWNSPELVRRHPEKACECALLMQKELESLNKKWKEKGLPEIEIRIGINSGDALSGNIGSPYKMKFGVVGDTVNTASRVENINKYYGTNKLITEATRSRIKGFIVRPVDRVRVKGRTGFTELYELMARQAEASETDLKLAAVTTKAFQLYLQGQFVEALKVAETAAVSGFAADGPLWKLREHCKKLIANPPPKNWDGATSFHEK